MNTYIGFKFAHILTAIIALGTGAAVGMLVGFFGDDATHGAYVLRLSRRLLYGVVLPGYVLMLGTGMWMGHLADLLDARWTEAAMNLWGVGALFYACFAVFLRRRITSWETAGPSSPACRRAAWLTSMFGAGAGLVVLVILALMVFKPV
ncbi:MAG TPA: DUF2269 family protein [Steroidobacteraceae bacterium]